jgi:hypothetical protein
VSAAAASPAVPEPAASTVDERNPWLGLASFTEETRRFFYGREDEVAELARRVQRKLLTVLFGQSGLGKTSILRAGLVPRLRAQGYCPVYVRIDYGRDAPEPAEQIKQAIARTARRSGEWTRAGVAVAGESLWEFLHHRDDVLQDESGATLIPLLIFDQFEEIFTLAQSDEFGRARAARFVADLADLVENRPPRELEARLDEDDTAAERFDFARGDYRVLVALREDYLAPLEGLKGAMPSITQNRLRLAPMTGQQALAAVVLPGKGLVAEEVAAAIVRFVAGGAELANAEVEPSLLSLICRELNDTRLAQGRSEISLDLLAGSHATILSNYYERSLADQPPAVRRIIEDELLTESGFRENVAEERMLSSFAAAGAAADTLATLVNRRLLRIEERLDVRRVELTHDVLCAVVKHSRDRRHEREARDASERMLAEQRDRARAARHALIRARQVALACAVLAIGAAAAAVYGYLSAERARRAERAAQETRAAAEQARTEAEHLLGYLNDDFAAELAGFGRLGLVTDLGKKEVAYYKSLPAVLQTPDTIRSAALAEVRYGIALQGRYQLDEADRALGEAVAALERLRAAGDDSEGTAVGLGLGLGAQSDVDDRKGRANPTRGVLRAEALLRPYAEAKSASVSARRAYAFVAASAASYQSGDTSLAMSGRAKQALASIGALDLSDLPAAADYSIVLAFEALELQRQSRFAEVRRVAAETVALASKVLEQRPGHLVALQARVFGYAMSGLLAATDLRIGAALRLGLQAEADGVALLRLDPTNRDARGRVAIVERGAANEAFALGQPRLALAISRRAVETLTSDAQHSSGGVEDIIGQLGYRARLEADLGDRASSEATLQAAGREREALLLTAPPGSFRVIGAACVLDGARGDVDLLQGDAAAARAVLAPLVEQLRSFKTDAPYVERERRQCLTGRSLALANAQYTLGDDAAAERTAAAALAVAMTREDPDARRMQARLAAAQAMALARLGRIDDAARAVAPAVKLQRELHARNHDDAEQRLELASTLYAQALADKARHDALLREAAGIIAALPTEMQALHSVGLWRDRLRAETRGGS